MMLAFMIIASLLFSVSCQSCLTIEQDGEGIVNEPTDLHCVLTGEAGYVKWSRRSLPGDSSNTLAQVNVGDGTVTVYEDTVSASWTSNVFTLTINSTSLDDDEMHAEWICELLGTNCDPRGIGHYITVKGMDV